MNWRGLSLTFQGGSCKSSPPVRVCGQCIWEYWFDCITNISQQRRTHGAWSISCDGALNEMSMFEDTFKGSVISSRYRVIQLKLFQHANYILARLHKLAICFSTLCFWGCGETVDFSPLFLDLSICPWLLKVNDFISSPLEPPSYYQLPLRHYCRPTNF